jgi:hypothetical protein
MYAGQSYWRKFGGLASADMARLPHLINTKIVFICKRPSQSAGTMPILNLFYKGNRPFLNRHSPSSSLIAMTEFSASKLLPPLSPFPPTTRGRCYDHNFLRFSAKKLSFFSKINAMIKILDNLALF